MSSILTNSSAMVALQTLRGINKNLAQTQSEISTGKSVGSARDNAAVWAISKTMESDVNGFRAISDSLALGQSTVAVARQAAETTTDLLTQMKGLIVAAQEENVDRAKIQTDIVALREQISSVINAAQFNGLNLVNGSSTQAVNVLSSLDRDSNGNVNAANISVARQSLSVSGTPATQTIGTTQVGTTPADRDALFSVPGVDTQTMHGGPVTWATANTAEVTSGNDITLTVGQAYNGASFQIALTGINVLMQDGTQTVGNRVFSYVAGPNDGVADVASNMVDQLNAFFAAATPANGAGDPSYVASLGTNGQIVIENDSGAAMRVGAAVSAGGTPGAAGGAGGLQALQTINVTTNSGADAALAMIDDLIEVSVNAAAGFGSAQARIDTQAEFIQNLMDSLTSGIGSLVDADMEAASARLQALQVQQQLATQSLSIANQQPQNILALFR